MVVYLALDLLLELADEVFDFLESGGLEEGGLILFELLFCDN
jgi:hypothetical protein